jgi:hypothetical protein
MSTNQTDNHENLTSFRAVPDRPTLATDLGPLNDLPGRWSGHGFNLIARPDHQGGNDIFLELNLTKETLDFMTIGSPIPNRGSGQDDIFLRGVHYLQQITDATTHGALHIEPGIWLKVPPTTDPEAAQTVARLACIPHGDAANMQGKATSIEGGPRFEPANTVPFPIRGTPPPPGTPNGFPEYDLSKPTPFRTSGLPAAITQGLVTDPNTMLSGLIRTDKIAETQVLEVSTQPTGGVVNIPFIVDNADAAFASAIFWIEKVEHPNGHTFMQLQYTQTVLLNFLGLSWPHVSVATLIKTF